MKHNFVFKPFLFLLLLTLSFSGISQGVEIAERDVKIATIDFEDIRSTLANTLLDKAANFNFETGVSIELPFLESSMRFQVLETQLMDPTFARDFPQIKTYRIQALEDINYTGRLTLNDKVLYATIFHKGEIITINPIDTNSNIYEINDRNEDLGSNWCGQDHEHESQSPGLKNPEINAENITTLNAAVSNGSTLRTLDFALVCTGEFFAANGGTVAAATTVATNSINAIEAFYENEIAVNFNLLTPFIYTNAATDPFSPGLNRTDAAAAAVDANFAQNSYDIGHVFHDQNQGNAELPGGGVAYIGVICNNSTTPGGGYFKGGGWSGSFSNTGNSWYQLAAHEIGHMFDCPHTWNGTGNSCVNAPSSSAYEIGSGTTIMAYNGICSSAQNVPDSGTDDNYFHAHSISQMVNMLLSTSCYNTSATGNTPPVSNAGANYTIPKSTPFELTGSASDANGDALTYCWEQYDEDGSGAPTQGFLGNTAAASTIAPLFRSYPPTSANNRIFPELSNILAGNNNGVTFEALPSVARTMNFRLGVRDNRANGGGYSCDNMTVTVAANAGPFTVSSQNVATTWNADGTSTANITWNVNGTNMAPVNCTNVDILFSTDGGQTFPFILASNTPNDGLFTVTIPSYVTNIGRIKIQCSNNIFFDINNANIEITSSCLANGADFSPTNNVTANAGTAALNLGLSPNFDNPISFPISGNITGTETLTSATNAVVDCANNSSCTNFNAPTGFTFNYDPYEFYVTESGSYTFSITSGFNSVMQLFSGPFNPNAGCNNLLGMSRCFNAPNTITNTVFDITVNLTPGQLYSLAVSDFFFGTATGSYTISLVSTPAGGAIYDGPNVPPASGFNYTFVVVNTATNTIAGFSTTGDLRSYPAGTYKVYGLSYTSSANLNSFIGTSFTNFQNNLASLVFCGNLSTNCISVTITGSSNCPVNFSSNAGGQPALTGTESGAADYETNGLIESTQTIAASGMVDYDSASEIALNPGFNTILGAVFHAFIDGCGGTQLVEPEADEILIEDAIEEN